MTHTAPSSCTTALQALALQRSGLEQLEAALNGPLQKSLEQAVQRILTLKGHVIVTGVGKSGHIGRKVQATLASTGTPSLFLHPAEAAHGDLGMISRHDLVLAFSTSGESTELAPILTYATRLGLTKIAITSHAASTLAHMADICLLLPQTQEACPMGLAPTTSSLLQLAFGDVFAITLQKERGFSSTDFGNLHPAGRLGTYLRPISDLMHTGGAMPLGTGTMSLRSVILEMTRKSFGCMGVIDQQGHLCGLIADGDLRRALELECHLAAITARDVMNPSPLTAGPEMPVQDVVRLMNNRAVPISSLFVVDSQKRPLGILHLHDLLRAGAA